MYANMRIRCPDSLERFLRSATGRAAGPVVMASAAAIPVVEARLVGVVVGGAVVALSHLSVRHQVEELARLNADTLEDEICEMLVHNINLLEHLKRTEGGLFRASVMLVDPTRKVLAVTMCSHAFSDGDREVVWAKGEGPPGLAWELGRLVIAPHPSAMAPRARGAQHTALRQTGGPRASGQSSNGMPISPAQSQFLSRVEMMVCYPITDLEHPNRVVGVLTLDDRLPPGPHLEDVLSAAEFLRGQIQRRLRTRRDGANAA